jgi:hypothetical protein
MGCSLVAFDAFTVRAAIVIHCKKFMHRLYQNSCFVNQLIKTRIRDRRGEGASGSPCRRQQNHIQKYVSPKAVNGGGKLVIFVRASQTEKYYAYMLRTVKKNVLIQIN